MIPHAIRVFDDAVPLPDDYRAAALARRFEDIPAGAAVFHNLSPLHGRSPLSILIENSFPVVSTSSFFRLSPEGQEEPNYIHADADMGEWSGILYLNPDPPNGDGTTFWRRKGSGEIATPFTEVDERRMEGEDWGNLDLWEPWHTVEARYNRLLMFPATYYHSRAIFENWGTGREARLIQMIFGTGLLPCVQLSSP